MRRGRPNSAIVYDGANLVEELNAAGAATAQYAQGAGIDEPLAANPGGTLACYEADELGSITSLTDNSGSAVAAYIRDAFGKPISSADTLGNRFPYTGREWDEETGLYYYRARYYEPAGGRFISQDPIAFDGGINFYRYVRNNPATLTDSMGLSPSCLGTCIKIYYGITRDAGVILGLSAPVVPYAGLSGATGATSVASVILRKICPWRASKGIWAPTITNIFARTPVVGAALARWLPVARLALVAIDVYGIQDCTRRCERDHWFQPCSKCQQGAK